MSSKRTYVQWLGTLGPKVAGIRIEIGAKTQGGGTAGIVAIAGRNLEMAGESIHVPFVAEHAELAEIIKEMASGAGWPEEERRMRLYALDKTGKTLASFQRTERASRAAGESKSDTVIMFEQMAGMLSRQLATIEKLVATQSSSIEQLSDANNHALSTTMNMMDAMIEAREYAADTAAHTAVLEHALDNQEEAEGGGYLELAKDAIAAVVGSGATEETPAEMTPEDIARKAAADPFFAADLKDAMKPKGGEDDG